MSILDLRTVLFSYIISNAICAIVMSSMWHQNRRRSPELGFWLADFVMQFLSILVIFLRGILPDFISIMIGIILIVGGTLLLYIGLERYVGQRSSQRYNLFLLGLFILVHAYFTFMQPSLLARNINLSLGLLVICSQAAWLMLRRVDMKMRQTTQTVGGIFAAYSLVSLIRIFVDLAIPPGNDFFRSGLYGTLVILLYQMLFIALTFALFLMVNRRQFFELENDIRERKSTEEALKKSEEKFAKAFQNSPEIILMTSLLEGKIIDANETFFRVSGYSREESLERTSIDLNLWGSLAERSHFAERLQKEGRVLNFETSFRKKSSEIFTGWISGEIIDLQGTQYVLSTINDVTERKRTEEILKETEAKFSEIFLATPTAYTLSDLDGKLIEVNPAFCQMTGYLHDEVIGKTTVELNLISPRELQRMHESTNPSDGALNNFELEMVKRDGTIFSVLLFRKIISLNGKPYRLGAAIDIHKGRLAEKKLFESEARFRNLFEHSAVGISMTGVNGSLNVNKSFCAMLGYTEEELNTQKWMEISHPDDLQKTTEIVQALLSEKNEQARFEKRYIHKNGDVIWADVSTYLQRDEKRDPQFFVTVVIDITERKRTEAEIMEVQTELQRLLAEADRSRRALLSVVEDQKRVQEQVRQLNAKLEQRVSERTAQLEASNKELEAFAYSVSHDLRAPLRAIDGFSHILEKEYDPKLDDEGKRLLSIIRRNTAKMDHLITDLLALSRVSRSQLNHSPIDMTALVNSIYHEIATPDVLQKFVFSASDLPWVSGDPTLLRQVWTNLISNAIKYTLPREECRIDIRGSKKDGLCTYSICDNGVGFNPQYTDKLFGLFQRLHKESEFAGTGVGLAIVHRIVHRHGGQVWAEGEVGKGATFYFTIPIREVKHE